MIRKHCNWGNDKFMCENDRKQGKGDEKYYKIKHKIYEREFPGL